MKKQKKPKSEPMLSDIMRKLQKEKDIKSKEKNKAPVIQKKDGKLEGGYSLGLSGNHPYLNTFKGKVYTNGKNIQVVLLDLLKSYQ